jgi:hypothetical protein
MLFSARSTPPTSVLLAGVVSHEETSFLGIGHHAKKKPAEAGLV